MDSENTNFQEILTVKIQCDNDRLGKYTDEYIKSLQEIREIYKSTAALMRPSKKIKKLGCQQSTRQNVLKLTPFVIKWRELRKKDKEFKKKTKNWRLGFKIMPNGTTLYKRFFNSVWVYFKITTQGEELSLSDPAWYTLFENLIDYIKKSVHNSKVPILDRVQKHQTYHLCIKGLSSFTIDDLPLPSKMQSI